MLDVLQRAKTALASRVEPTKVNFNLQEVQEVKRLILVMACFARLGDEEGQVQCIEKLIELVKHNETNKELVRIQEGFQMIADLAESKNDRTRLCVANFVTHLATNDHNSRVLCELELYVPLAEMLSSSDLDVQTAACRCIATLLRHERARRDPAIEKSRLIQLLIERSQRGNIESHPHICDALASLTHISDHRAVACDNGLVPAVVWMCEGVPTVDVRLHCATILGNVARDKKRVEFLIREGAILVLVSFLDHWSPEVVQSALETLLFLKTEDAIMRIHIAPNSISMISRCATSNTSPPQTKLLAQRLLLRMIEFPNLLRDLVNHGVVDIVVEKLEADQDTEKCLRGLSFLLSDPNVQQRFVNDLNFQDLVYSLGHALSATIQEPIALALFKLSENRIHQPFLVNDEVRRGLLLKLGQSDDIRTRRHAARTLSKLAQNPEASIHLRNRRAFQVLVSMTRSHDEEVLRYGAIAVVSMPAAEGFTLDVVSSLRILTQFGQAPNPAMQIQAATALGNIALNHEHRQHMLDSHAIDLLNQLINSPNDGVRSATKVALSNFNAAHQLGILSAYANISEGTIGELPLQLIHDLVTLINQTKDGDVMRVGLATLANITTAKENMRKTVQCHGIDTLSRFIQPSAALPIEWKDDIATNAARALGNGLHEPTAVESVLQHPNVIQNLIKQLSTKRTPSNRQLKVACCQTMANLARESLEAQHVLLREYILWSVNKLMSCGDPVLEVVAAEVVLALASTDGNCLEIVKAGSLAGVLKLLDSPRAESVRKSVAMLSSVCRAQDNHPIILEMLGMDRVATLLQHHDDIVRQHGAELIEQIAQNRRNRVVYHIQFIENGIIEILAHMMASKAQNESHAACITLALLSKNKEVIERLREIDILPTIQEIAVAISKTAKIAAAEILIRLVDVERDSDFAVGTDILVETISLARVGDGPLPCKAGAALANLCKRHRERMILIEHGVLAAFLQLVRSASIEAERAGIHGLLELSKQPGLEHKILEAGSMSILIHLATKVTARDAEVEICALQVICNLLLEEKTMPVLTRMGAGSTLHELRRTVDDEGISEIDGAAKRTTATIAVNHMESWVHCKRLARYEGLFPKPLTADGVRDMVKMLQGDSNVLVARCVSTLIANLATKPENLAIIQEAEVYGDLVLLLRSRDYGVVGDTARAIGNLALNDVAQRQFVTLGAVDQLVRVLNEIGVWCLPTDALLETLIALENLARAPYAYHCGVTIISEGGMPAMANALSIPNEDVKRAVRSIMGVLHAAALPPKPLAQVQPPQADNE